MNSLIETFCINFKVTRQYLEQYSSWLFFIASGSFVFSAFVFLAYKLIRRKFPVLVNCWFCNKDEQVAYEIRNCWICSNCDQYNGFTKDGHYNKPIASQYDELKPKSNYSVSNGKTTPLTTGNGFCKQCNVNQQLKIKALANFTPKNEKKYEEEIEVYKQYLELTYGLCRHCEAVLRQTLGRQDSFLRPQFLSWKLQQSCLDKSTYDFPKRNVLTSSRGIKFEKISFHLHLLAFFLIMLSFSGRLCVEKQHSNYVFRLPLPKYLRQVMLVLRHNATAMSIWGLTVFIPGFVADKYRLKASYMTLLLWPILLITDIFIHKEIHLTHPVPAETIRLGLCGIVSLLLSIAALSSRPIKKKYTFQKHTVAKQKSLDASIDTSSSAHFSDQTESEDEVQDHEVSTSSAKKKNGLNVSLGAMTLGQQTIRSRKEGMFSLQNYSAPLQSNISPEPRPTIEPLLKRPVVSPARFHPQKPFNLPMTSMWGKYAATNWNVPHYDMMQQRPLCAWNHMETARGYYSHPPTFYYNHNQSALAMLHGSGYHYSPWGMHGPISHGYSPSLPTSRQGSLCGDDRASVFSEPTFLSANFHSSDAFHSAGDHTRSSMCESGRDSASNSSRSSACPVDTTTSEGNSFNQVESERAQKSFSPGTKIALVLSLIANVVAVGYYISDRLISHLPFSFFNQSLPGENGTL